jgi:GT2 family glycosyltransferase
MRAPLTVVVPTRDRPEILASCLQALASELGSGDEVVVADSASTDAAGVARVVAAAGATLVRCDVKGASRARNAGWRAAHRDLVVFVDDDVWVRPGWAEALAAAAGDGAAFALGRTVAPEGFAGDGGSVTYGTLPERLDAATVGRVAATNPLLVRRELLLSSGGFDERLGPGTWFEAGEDLELLDRLLATGGSGRYAENAVAVHEQWRTAQERRRLQWSYGKGMGARTGAALRRDRRAGLAMLPDLLRLKGLVTALRRARGQAPAAPAGDGGGHADAGGWLSPVLWRLGALVGLLAGLVRLGPGRPAGG